jgi:hypothetical protein
LCCPATRERDIVEYRRELKGDGGLGGKRVKSSGVALFLAKVCGRHPFFSQLGKCSNLGI